MRIDIFSDSKGRSPTVEVNVAETVLLISLKSVIDIAVLYT